MSVEYPLFYSSSGQSVTGPSHDFNIYIGTNPLILTDSMRIGIKSITLVNSWYTISEFNKNNQFQYINLNDVTRTITIPNSQKTVSEINTVLFNAMVANGDHVGPAPASVSFNVDISIGKVVLIIDNGFKLELRNSLSDGFSKLIGFDSILYNITTIGANRARIGFGINNLILSCSLAVGLFSNTINSRAMLSIPILVGPSRIISFIPQKITFMPVQPDSHNVVIFKITDQDGNFIDLNNEKVSIELILRTTSKII